MAKQTRKMHPTIAKTLFESQIDDDGIETEASLTNLGIKNINNIQALANIK